MGTLATRLSHQAIHPVQVHVEPAIEGRNRLTGAFRLILALPHLILVGGPMAVAIYWTSSVEGNAGYQWGGAGVLGAAAVVVTVIAWFAILFTGRHPAGLRDFAAFYLRWRVRAAAYAALLRDEYPPFGDGPYRAVLELQPPDVPRDRLTVALRVVLAIPHIIAVWALGVAWALTTLIAWLAILFTGRYPAGLHRFGVGVLRWSTRVEAYLLLLHDDYPPFSLT
jgi:hypothetical protein